MRDEAIVVTSDDSIGCVQSVSSVGVVAVVVVVVVVVVVAVVVAVVVVVVVVVVVAAFVVILFGVAACAHISCHMHGRLCTGSSWQK